MTKPTINAVPHRIREPLDSKTVKEYTDDLGRGRQVRVGQLHLLAERVLALNEHSHEVPADWWLLELERLRRELDAS